MASRNAAYKQRTVGFANLEQRRVMRAMAETQSRKTRRSALRDTKRNVEIIPSPNVSDENFNATKKAEHEPDNGLKLDRRAQLMRWKAKKELEKQLQKRNQLPAFRAGICHHKLNSPIFLHQLSTTVKPPKPATPRLTRATAKRLAARGNSASQTKTRLPTKKTSKTSVQKKLIETSFAPVNHQFKAPNGLSPMRLFGQEALGAAKTVPKTPPVYFSPYVVSARGKKASRQEQLLNMEIAAELDNVDREDKDLLDKCDDKESIAKCDDEGELTPTYFRSITEKEINRLRGVCKHWFEIKSDNDIPEGAKDLINQTICQTNLMIDKKMEQFKKLICNCEDGSGIKPVTPQDLQGFWEMIYLQVENCDMRFTKLVQLQERNWVEEEINKPKIVKPIVANRKPAPSKTVVPSKSTSSLREMIRAARRQRMNASEKADVPAENVVVQNAGNITEPSRLSAVKFDGGFFMVESPMKAVTPRSVEKSTPLQKLDLSKESRRRRSAVNSISVSQQLKPFEIKPVEIENDPSIVYVNSLQTPGRSILKQTQSRDSSILKSDTETMRIKKQLNFQHDLSDSESHDEEKENVERCKTPEVKEAEPVSSPPQSKDSIIIAKSTRRYRRRTLNERNGETASDAACIQTKDCATPYKNESFTDKEDQKENERPKSPDVPKQRRSTRKSVKFTGEECTVCADAKIVYPMTPRSKRRASRVERRSTNNTEDLIKWETPKEPLPRVRRSLRIKNAQQ